MRLLFPSSYDRADVLMSAGCSTFVSAALILVIPRFGILLLEILLGLFFIGCALIARTRLRRQARGADKPDKPGTRARWFDRYDVFMILAVIALQTCAAGSLRKAGLSEGTVGIIPLFLFAAGILLKPRVLDFIQDRRKRKQPDGNSARTADSDSDRAAGIQTSDVRTQPVVHGASKNGDLE